MPASARAKQIYDPSVKWARWILLLAVLGLPWFFGGNRPLALSAYGLLLGIAALSLGIATLQGKRLRLPAIPIGLFALWLFWQALQCSPLVSDWLSDWVSLPQAYAHAAAGVCFSPQQSQLRLLESGMLALLFVLIINLYNNRRWLTRLLLAFVIAGALQAMFGSLMVLTGSERLLLTAKEHYIGFATGGFVNRNHFASYLNLCLACAVGLLIATGATGTHGLMRERISAWLDTLMSPKIFTRVAAAVMVVGLVLSRSRMGNAAFFISLTAAFGLYLLLAKGDRRPGLLVLLASMLIVDLFILGNWYGLDELSERIQETSLATESRYDVIPDFKRMAETFWPWGIGLGSLATVYPEYRSSFSGSGFYNHVHNDYLEFLIEAGVGVVFMALLTLLANLKAIYLLRTENSRLVRGACLSCIMASTAILLHISVEFSLQIPGVSTTWVCLLALPWLVEPLRSKLRKAD